MKKAVLALLLAVAWPGLGFASDLLTAFDREVHVVEARGLQQFVADVSYSPTILQVDPRQGQVLAEILIDRDITSVALTYTNDSYGKELGTAFSRAYSARGGTVAITISHQRGGTNYFTEVGALAAAGVEHLVVFGHLEHGGTGLVQTALDTGAFEKFVLGDGMIGEALLDAVGDQLNGAIGTLPGTQTTQELSDSAAAAQEKPVGATAAAYDAGALMAIAIEAVGNVDRLAIREKLLSIASDESQKILPGELDRALDLLQSDSRVSNQAVSSLTLTGVGQVSDAYREIEIRDGKFETIKIR